MRALAYAAFAVIAWGGLAALFLVAFCRTVRRREAQVPACCPHPGGDVPEAVRGEFRAVVTR